MMKGLGIYSVSTQFRDVMEGLKRHRRIYVPVVMQFLYEQEKSGISEHPGKGSPATNTFAGFHRSTTRLPYG